jgi:hypothetical protein
MLVTLYVVHHNPINPSDAELNPIRHLLALAGAHHFVHVSRVTVNQCYVPTPIPLMLTDRHVLCRHVFL